MALSLNAKCVFTRPVSSFTVSFPSSYEKPWPFVAVGLSVITVVHEFSNGDALWRTVPVLRVRGEDLKYYPSLKPAIDRRLRRMAARMSRINQSDPSEVSAALLMPSLDRLYSQVRMLRGLYDLERTIS